MQGTFTGLNTAVIKNDNHFLALLLKLKDKSGNASLYYMQAPVLVDLMLCLRSRMDIVTKRLSEEGEDYKAELIAANEALLANTPQIEMTEVQQPAPERRVMSITFKPGNTSSTLVTMLPNEHVVMLDIDDMHIEAVMVAIQQALTHAGEEQLLQLIGLNMTYLMLYTVDLTRGDDIDYQHQAHEQWKLNLFSHYLAVLYCYETDQGKNILAGAVIKTSFPHPSNEENQIVMLASKRNLKLKSLEEKYPLCQIFTRIIPSQPGKMLSLAECLRPVHAFFVEQQAKLN